MSSWDGVDISLNYEELGDKFYEKGLSDFQSKNFLRGEQRFLDGIENLEKAIEQYIRGDCDEKAAKASYALAESYEQTFIKKDKGDFHQMAKYWELAGECHEDFSFKKMIECYGKTAYYQQSNDNFQSAAKTYLLMANFHIEKEHMNEALECFDKATDAFRAAGSNVHVAKTLTEKAQYQCRIGFHLEAANTFIDIIRSKVVPFDNSSLGFQAMLAVLVYCALANADEHTQSYNLILSQIHPKWLGSWEERSISKMIAGWKSDDSDQFTDAVRDYNLVSTIDPWEVNLMLKIKRVMKGEYELSDSGDSDDADGNDMSNPNTVVTYPKAYINITPIDIDDDDNLKIHQSKAILTPTNAEKMAELLR